MSQSIVNFALGANTIPLNIRLEILKKLSQKRIANTMLKKKGTSCMTKNEASKAWNTLPKYVEQYLPIVKGMTLKNYIKIGPDPDMPWAGPLKRAEFAKRRAKTYKTAKRNRTCKTLTTKKSHNRSFQPGRLKKNN